MRIVLTALGSRPAAQGHRLFVGLGPSDQLFQAWPRRELTVRSGIHLRDASSRRHVTLTSAELPKRPALGELPPATLTPLGLEVKRPWIDLMHSNKPILVGVATSMSYPNI